MAVAPLEPMKVDLERCALVPSPPGEDRFEAVRERRGLVTAEPGGGHDVLCRTVVDCRTHALVDGGTCERCPHFLCAVADEDGRHVRVRCVLLESDRVEALMTRAGDLVTVPLHERTSTAAARMVDHELRQLLVTSQDKVIGVIAASAITNVWDRVARHLTCPIPIIPRTMSLGAAARGFRASDLDMAAVLDGDEVVGVLTRGDLRRAGVPGV